MTNRVAFSFLYTTSAAYPSGFTCVLWSSTYDKPLGGLGHSRERECQFHCSFIYHEYCSSSHICCLHNVVILTFLILESTISEVRSSRTQCENPLPLQTKPISLKTDHVSIAFSGPGGFGYTTE